MGRYADTPDGELTLSALTGSAISYIIGSFRSRDCVVALNQEEVASVVKVMEHMTANNLTDPRSTTSVFDLDIDGNTMGWYMSHLRGLPGDMALLKSWLKSGKDSLVFC